MHYLKHPGETTLPMHTDKLLAIFVNQIIWGVIHHLALVIPCFWQCITNIDRYSCKNPFASRYDTTWSAIDFGEGQSRILHCITIYTKLFIVSLRGLQITILNKEPFSRVADRVTVVIRKYRICRDNGDILEVQDLANLTIRWWFIRIINSSKPYRSFSLVWYVSR